MTAKHPLPDVLYKFYGPERAAVLRTHRVRFSQLGALNDPFEFVLTAKEGDFRKGIDRIARQVTSFIQMPIVGVSAAWRALRENEQLSAPWPLRLLLAVIVFPVSVVFMILLSPFFRRFMRKAMAAMAEHFERLLFKGVREGLILVFSCAETWRSAPMWAHYANNHVGFAIGLDPATAFADKSPKANDPFLKPRKVRYMTEAPRLNPTSLDIKDFITAKMSHWSYEEEWRFVNMPDHADERGSFHNGHEILLFDLQPTSIREVVLGARSTPETAAAVLTALEAAALSPDIYQVRVSEGYRFERVRIQTLDDLEFTVAENRPVRGLRDQDLERTREALLGFVDEAQRNRVARWLLTLNRGPPKV